MAATTFECLNKPKAGSFDLSRAVDHHQFSHNTSRADGVIVVFRVSYYERPSSEHYEAQERVLRAIAGLRHELAMMGAWGGGVSVRSMEAKQVNPEITPAMIEGYLAAAAQAYPEMRLTDHWKNMLHGEHGYSVLMCPKE